MGFVALFIIQLLVLADAVNLTDVYPTYQSENCSFFTNLDTSAVDTLDSAFLDFSLVCDGESWYWDVSRVTSMANSFQGASFNSDIGSWDVTKVTDMDYTFYMAFPFESDIGSWDVTRVTTMDGTFDSAYAFKSDIGSWDVAKVTSMNFTFSSANAFNSDIGSWDVAKVTTMGSIFFNAITFDGDLSSWCVAAVTDHANFCGPTRSCTEPIWETCPTGAPTAPTFSPTGMPTLVPTTGMPTSAPTTGAPTAPTFSPTGTPTSAPTTGAPTTTPTFAPTEAPTTTPTFAPTDIPTAAPSTEAPTSAPTATPTATPTAEATPCDLNVRKALGDFSGAFRAGQEVSVPSACGTYVYRRTETGNAEWVRYLEQRIAAMTPEECRGDCAAALRNAAVQCRLIGGSSAMVNFVEMAQDKCRVVVSGAATAIPGWILLAATFLLIVA